MGGPHCLPEKSGTSPEISGACSGLCSLRPSPPEFPSTPECQSADSSRWERGLVLRKSCWWESISTLPGTFLTSTLDTGVGETSQHSTPGATGAQCMTRKKPPPEVSPLPFSFLRCPRPLSPSRAARFSCLHSPPHCRHLYLFFHGLMRVKYCEKWGG